MFLHPHSVVPSLCQIRGMTIDQALAQLEFNDKKGAKIIREVRVESSLNCTSVIFTPEHLLDVMFKCWIWELKYDSEQQVLLEAQEMAVKSHSVEYKSNLYVGKYLYLEESWF